MKFKYKGIVFNLDPIIGAIWAFIGLMCIGWTFMLNSSPWWLNIIWFLVVLVYISTAEFVAKKLTNKVSHN